MKPQTWFRLYNEVVDDPKVQQLPARLFKNWINFMCLISKGGGTLPSWTEVAYRLRTTETNARKWLDELKVVNLFEETEDGAVHSHNWDGRQFKSDVSTDRVKRFRNGNRNVSETAIETPAPETDTETETKQNPQPPRAVLYSTEFLEFWSLYPRKESKGEAWKSWNKLRPSTAIRVDIAQAIERQKKSFDWTKENGQYIPQPSTWLNKRKWEDEGTTTQAAASIRPKGLVF